jgi:hypothetical protein
MVSKLSVNNVCLPPGVDVKENPVAEKLICKRPVFSSAC